MSFISQIIFRANMIHDALHTELVHVKILIHLIEIHEKGSFYQVC